MRIGLFGGSFDPPHRGHLALVRLAIECMQLDRVLVAPVGTQPLKRDMSPASFLDRVAMVKLAIAGDPRMELSLADAPRAGGQPNYTFQTVQELREELTAQQILTPDERIFCILGADSFLTIGSWHYAAELLMACDFIVGARPGFALGRLAAALPESISVAAEEDGGERRLVLGLRGAEGRQSKLYLLPDLAEDISATEIRNAIREGSEAQTVLDPKVVAYIREQGLYQS
jgi:nicotinate-nucleotide adenylyltransferase